MANKKTIKSLLLTALVVACVIALGVLSVSAEVYTGTCSAEDDVSNVTWSFDTETGTLTIAGTGAMADYQYGSSKPWDSYTYQIREIVIEEGVTRIGKWAFAFARNLTDISIPDSVETIGNQSFYKCTSLTKIVIPKNVYALEGLSLATCDALTSITVDEENQTYRSAGNCIIKGDTLISGCSVSVIPTDGSVKTIRKAAFFDCDSLTDITIPEGVETIGEEAFLHCSNLVSVTLPESIKSIGNTAFSSCIKLEALTIGKNVSYVGETAFDGSNKLTLTVDIQNKYYHICSLDGKVTKYGVSVEDGNLVISCAKCASVKDTYFKDSKPIVSLDFETPIADALDAEKMPVTIYGVPGYDAGKDGKGLLLSDKTQTAVFVNDAEHTLFAPEKMILNFDVKFNGNEKSDYQESIVSFIYGQAGVKNVGTTRNWCFVLRYIEDAEGKAYLSMNNSLDAGNVLEVEDGKWYGCTVVAYEGKYMLFIDGIYMGEKTRPDYTDEAYGGGTTFRIGDSRQTNFTIDSITVHSLITENTTGESVAIYEGECGENTTWSFDPDTYTLTIDGTGAMNDYELALDAPWYIYAKDIKTVVISEGVTYIGANAFKNYVALLSVKLSSTVTDIGKDAFMNTWKMVEIINLSELELTLGSTDYGRIAQRCNVIHSGDSKIVYEGGLGFYRINLTWSSLVDYIGNDSVLVLPENHEGHQYNIGVRAFEGNEYLEEVTLGNTPYIGAKAFLDCKNLKKVTVGATTTNVDATAFDGCENVEFVLDKDNAYLTACLHKGILVNVNRVVNANGDVQLLCSSCGTLKDSYKLGEDKLLELDFETAVEETLDAEKMPVTITGSVEYADRDGAKALQLNKGMVYINDTEKALFASAQMMMTFDVKILESEETEVQEPIISVLLGYEGATQVEGATPSYESLLRCFRRADGSVDLGIGADDIKERQIDAEVGKWYSCTVFVDTQRYYLYVDGVSVGSTPRNDYSADRYCGAATLRIGEPRTNAAIDNLLICGTQDAHTECVFDREIVEYAFLKEAANCTSGAVYYKSCVCGAVGEDSFNYGTPVHSYGEWIKHDDTQHIRVCDCGDTEYSDHIWDAGIVIQQASCSKSGVKVYTCEVCNGTKQEDLPATGKHEFGNWSKHDAKGHARHCECGEMEYEDESWDDGVVTTKPTAHKEGVKTYTCDKCHATKTEVIDKTKPHDSSLDPTVTVETVNYDKADGTVEVDIILKDNPGIIGMQLEVEYNTEVFTLSGVKDGGILGIQIHTDNYMSPYLLTWTNFTATENITAEGVIATLTFTVAEDAVTGTYPITVSYNYDNYEIVNVDMEPVEFATENGAVIVSDGGVIYGDVNSDGAVNMLDGIFLGRYIANWSGYTAKNVNLAAADVNRDGNVNMLDGIILGRYIAKWIGYESLPHVQ